MLILRVYTDSDYADVRSVLLVKSQVIIVCPNNLLSLAMHLHRRLYQASLVAPAATAIHAMTAPRDKTKVLRSFREGSLNALFVSEGDLRSVLSKLTTDNVNYDAIYKQLPAWMGAMPRRNAPWNEAEENRLCREYCKGTSIHILAEQHLRDEGGIRSRLARVYGVDYGRMAGTNKQARLPCSLCRQALGAPNLW